MKQFKLRASAGGNMLTAKGAMSKAETPKTFIKEWYITQITGKRKVINSKYLRRGIESENLAIQRVDKDLIKNEQFFENEYFTGTPDIVTDDTIIDVKCSWDAFTFPFFMKEPPMNYLTQLQIYMELTGKRKAKLCYCLENGTMEQINQLAWQKAKDEGLDEPSIENWDEADKDLNYDHLPEKLRIKTFEIEYNPEMIESLKESVEFAREYIETELTPFVR